MSIVAYGFAIDTTGASGTQLVNQIAVTVEDLEVAVTLEAPEVVVELP